MSDAPVVFESVTKRFAKGQYQDSLRDLLARLLPGRRRAADRKRAWFNAVDDLTFHVGRGEALGIIGPNGSGKSTALKLLTGIYVPTSGSIRVQGRVAPLIEVGAGFHPDLTGRENIFLNGAISGMSRAEIRAHFDEIVAFSGLEEFLDTPVKRYSSGMYMRLGFAIAAHVPSEVLVVDEVLAVGDVGFRARCIERMQMLKRDGRTILFVSHNPFQVRSLCDRVVYVVGGRKEFDGDAVEGTARYEQDVLSGRVGERVATGKDRGDAAAALAGATVLAEASDEGVVLTRGDSLSVAVDYRIERASEAPPQLSVGLLRGDGVMACVLNSRQAGFALSNEPGTHRVTATLEDLPLGPARYSVEILLWDAEMVVVLDQISAGAVSLRAPDDVQPNRPGVFVPAGGFREEGA